jgi:tetratricopeptide (TPR) repeat protein
VRRRLSTDDAGKWLLIVDNADDMDLLFGSTDKPGMHDYLPESDNGLVLFTTRSREVAVSVVGGDVVDLNQMSHQDATSFLYKSIIRKELLQDVTITARLLQELTHLPLAIAQAAAYLNRNRLSIQKYLELLQSAEQGMVSLMSREFHDITRYRASQNAVASTWLVSFDQIRKSDRTAANLLSFLSCIEPKAIPQSILPGLELEEEIEHAIGTLCGYAFLTRREDENVFDMHSLVHMATQIWVQRHKLTEQTVTTGIKHLERIFPSFQRGNRELCHKYLPHTLKLLHGSEECDVRQKYDLFTEVGVWLHMDRRYKEAAACFEKSFGWMKENLPEDNKDRLLLEHWLALTYLFSGITKDAIRMFEHLVDVERSMRVEDDHSRLTLEHNLASAYLNVRRLEDAIPILEHVVEVRKRTLPEDDYVRLGAEQELARGYLQHGRIKDAIRLLEYVVDIRKGTLVEDDQDQLMAKHCLASAYLEDYRVEDATPIFEYVAKVQRENLAEDDQDRLWAEHELARAYYLDGRAQDALPIFEHVAEIRESMLSEDNESRLASEHCLAAVYLDGQRIKDAIRIFEHVVEVRKGTLTEGDQFRRQSEHELARAYLYDGQVAKSIEMLKRVVATESGILAEDDPERCASRDLLADAYRAHGESISQDGSQPHLFR